MICKKCHAEKAPIEFYVGRVVCKACVCASVRANRKAKIDQYRAYESRRAEQLHRRDLNRKVSAAWRNDNPQARAAQVFVGNAIRGGRLQRWPCEICGNKAHAHHPHYGAPLLVTWLCPTHHKAAHLLIESKP
jgi:hypothetical protein